MSHEVETMMVVGAHPWHGLGVKLTEVPTLDEAIKAAGLDWRVGFESLYRTTTDEHGNAIVGEEATTRSVIRLSDGKSLGEVGQQYKLLQNEKAFGWFAPFVDNGLATIESAGALMGGSRVWVLAKLCKNDLVVGKDDKVEKYILLSHSHDGTLAVRAGLTPIRVVCNNTLTMAHNQAKGLVKIRHSGDMAEKLKVAREAIELADGAFEKVGELYNFLANKPVRNEAQLRSYLDRVYGANVSKSRRANQVVELFEGGVGQDLRSAKHTWWGAFNAVTLRETHMAGRSAENRAKSNAWGNGRKLINSALKSAYDMSVESVMGHQIDDVLPGLGERMRATETMKTYAS